MHGLTNDRLLPPSIPVWQSSCYTNVPRARRGGVRDAQRVDLDRRLCKKRTGQRTQSLGPSVFRGFQVFLGMSLRLPVDMPGDRRRAYALPDQRRSPTCAISCW